MWTHGSLFSGIGGFDLGFERAGFKTIWQVEVDPFCKKVLEKHWPNVQRFDDIRKLDFLKLPKCDVVTGGFPCQDTSLAGDRAGLDGERSGLWFQMWESICVLQPRFVVVENVAGLLSLGFGSVVGHLARIGYVGEWLSICASAFGAEHERKRVFVVAYPDSARSQVWGKARADDEDAGIFGTRARLAIRTPPERLERRGEARWRGDVHGIPRRVDRIKALGNAVDPHIAEWIAKRIKAVLDCD